MCDMQDELRDFWGVTAVFCCVTGQVLLMFQKTTAFMYGVKQSKKNNYFGQTHAT